MVWREIFPHISVCVTYTLWLFVEANRLQSIMIWCANAVYIIIIDSGKLKYIELNWHFHSRPDSKTDNQDSVNVGLFSDWSSTDWVRFPEANRRIGACRKRSPSRKLQIRGKADQWKTIESGKWLKKVECKSWESDSKRMKKKTSKCNKQWKIYNIHR